MALMRKGTTTRAAKRIMCPRRDALHGSNQLSKEVQIFDEDRHIVVRMPISREVQASNIRVIIPHKDFALIRIGKTERIFKLPVSVHDQGVFAEFVNNTLRIILPKVGIV